jgi:hypothetical protein
MEEVKEAINKAWGDNYPIINDGQENRTAA